ncbi:MAG: hypothetical protein H0U27_04240, partial [Nitrosopumilus sp.]|nr:hypothetical protein [Nitrosopumilus sp.]
DYSVLWIEKFGIEKLEIGLLGYNLAKIVISGSNFVNKFTINETFDVTSAIPISYEGEIKIKVIVEQKIDKEYVIYNRSIPEFKNEELDALILGWQNELELSSTSLNYNPDFRFWKFQFRNLPKITHEDQHYFNGFLEYGIGSNLERKEEYSKAKKHLENAFGLLLPFGTILSKTVVRLLGLKMNCFYVLNNCSSQSLFAPADAMFNKNQKPSEVVFTKTQLSGTGVFIDSFSHLFLDTLSVFYDASDNQISVLLNALKRHPHSKEKNNADKIHLLTARYYSYVGEHQKAVEEFSFLEDHPLFGKEAKSYLTHQTK